MASRRGARAVQHQRGRTARRANQRKSVTSAKTRQRARKPREDRRTQPLDRTDVAVAAGTVVVAGALFASTFSSHVALGDAPESVVGIKSLGIVHAPGYVLYVLLAHAFGSVFAIGNWEFRANVFSLVCAAAACGSVYGVARIIGARRSGAVIGALALATTASFWFNAGFAKYYALSALLVASMTLLVFGWQQSGRSWMLVGAGVLLGASVGVSWQIALLVAVALAATVAIGARRPSWALVGESAGAALVCLIAVCVYTVIRAGQDPAINYGGAKSLPRLLELLTTSDFSGTRQAAGAGVSHFARGGLDYVGIVGRDVGLIAVALAIVGIVDLVRRRRFDVAALCAIVGVGNIVAIGVVSDINRISGFWTSLVLGGQLVGTVIVIALLAALGVSRTEFWIGQWLDRTKAQLSDGMRSSFAAVTVGVLGVAVLVPSTIVHAHQANHRTPALAKDYAERVLRALPRHSVLLAAGWEFGQPIVERQQLFHERLDVTVVSADSIAHDWYCEQLVRNLRLPSTLRTYSLDVVARYVQTLRQTRPVYVDALSMLFGSHLFGYQAHGIVGKVVDGTGPHASETTAADAARLLRIETSNGVASRKYDRFPNTTIYYFYQRAHIELAKEYALADDLKGAANELDRAFDGGFTLVDRSLVQAVRTGEPGAKERLLAL